MLNTSSAVSNRRTVLLNGAKQGPALTYDAADQVVGQSYDGAGNLLGDGTNTYSYNALNQLTGTSSNVSYAYNGDGALVSETQGPSTTRYLLDPTGGQSERLSRTANGTTTFYLRGWGAELADETSGTANWYVTDRLGSVRATTDAGGTVNAQYSYDAWGTPTNPAGSYGFTGEPQTTAGGGLLYLRARWYRPGAGRFLTTDPYAGSAATPASLHRYVYGADDPVGNSDPSGMCLDADDLGCHDHDPVLAPKPFCFGFTCATTGPQFMIPQHRLPTAYELGLTTANNRDRFGRGVAMAPGAIMSELFGWDPPKGYECACIIPVVGMMLADGGSFRGGGADLEGESLALMPAKVKGMVMPATAVEAATQQEAARLVGTLSNRVRGPVVTGIWDSRLNRFYSGINSDKSKMIPSNLYPLLRARLDEYLTLVARHHDFDGSSTFRPPIRIIVANY